MTQTPCGDPPFDPPYKDLQTGKIEFGPNGPCGMRWADPPTPKPFAPGNGPENYFPAISATELPGVERDRDLRDRFAGDVMKVLLGIRGDELTAEQIADLAYQLADAMMARRTK